MSRMIRHGQIVADDWQILALGEGAKAESVELPNGRTLLPLAVWLAHRDQVADRPESFGVWLNSHEEPAALVGDLARLAVIGVNFPKFTDGRGYSIARLLRERHHYQGEIRALGDVLQDQLFYMQRCGFDAFVVRADKDIERALAGLRVFSETYQAGVDQPQPLFCRRAKAETT
ncbi:MAG: DUF934 domain-containing protein [Candidatus Accumulibacter sp.]|uniref:DUF934 domain-containing protein n=1 Tax=Accumulibacter sp. TaxID=2053492 RepID=UPI00287939CF|nr:DUF934 domain-containing protein [Accumulibacter sp.]MDS4015223.1 DUF934 domain-containing protein [Accumulibacter sp.]